MQSLLRRGKCCGHGTNAAPTTTTPLHPAGCRGVVVYQEPTCQPSHIRVRLVGTPFHPEHTPFCKFIVTSAFERMAVIGQGEHTHTIRYDKKLGTRGRCVNEKLHELHDEHVTSAYRRICISELQLLRVRYA